MDEKRNNKPLIFFNGAVEYFDKFSELMRVIGSQEEPVTISTTHPHNQIL